MAPPRTMFKVFSMIWNHIPHEAGRVSFIYPKPSKEQNSESPSEVTPEMGNRPRAARRTGFSKGFQFLKTDSKWSAALNCVQTLLVLWRVNVPALIVL